MIPEKAIRVDHISGIPKYKQIVNSIQNGIKNKLFKQGEQLPSINYLKEELSVSRDTVIKAFREMAAMGIIDSIPGKGYYIIKESHEIQHHIFLLFDLFLPYKKTIYNSFIHSFGENTIVDIYFHHFNLDLYKKLIREAIGRYTDYVIIPIIDNSDELSWFKKLFHNLNVFILDLGLNEYGGYYPSVCQNFKKQWYQSFIQIEDSIKKYEQFELILYRPPVNQSFESHDRYMIEGYMNFCHDRGVNYRIIRNKDDFRAKKNHCYMIPDDEDLVMLVKMALEKKLTIGRDIGFISHNDAPLKSIICSNGVTTITTDFELMGKRMAELVISGEKRHVENPWMIIQRGSV